jgi:hypothetical protein
MSTFPLHDDLMPDPTDTARTDITTVYLCDIHRGCILRDDTYPKEMPDGSMKVCCRKHGVPVTDVTHSPLGQSWRMIVNPHPRKKGGD